MILPECYKATVNEPETIIAAQPHGPVSGRGGPRGLRSGCLIVSHIERS